MKLDIEKFGKLVQALSDRTKAIASIALLAELFLFSSLAFIPEDQRIFIAIGAISLPVISVIGVILIEILSINRNKQSNAIPAVTPSFPKFHKWALDFQKTIEPTIELPPIDGRVTIQAERAYRFVDYLFTNAKFKEFYAIDLAFCRWFELLDDDQIINVSKDLINGIEIMLRNSHCTQFRRIFVAERDQLTSSDGCSVLRRLSESEKKLNNDLKGSASIQTKVLLYSTDSSSAFNGDYEKRRYYMNTIAQIHKSCDFAVFSGDISVAVIETGLTSPLKSKDLRLESCDITSNNSTINELSTVFESAWRISNPIDEFLATCNPGVLEAKCTP